MGSLFTNYSNLGKLKDKLSTAYQDINNKAYAINGLVNAIEDVRVSSYSYEKNLYGSYHPYIVADGVSSETELSIVNGNITRLEMQKEKMEGLIKKELSQSEVDALLK